MSAGTNGLSSVILGGLALAVLGVQLGTGTYPVVRLYTSNRTPSKIGGSLSFYLP